MGPHCLQGGLNLAMGDPTDRGKKIIAHRGPKIKRDARDGFTGSSRPKFTGGTRIQLRAVRRRGELLKAIAPRETVGPAGDCLAWCFIGNDHNVERIADILSFKYFGAAMELREMARTPPPPKPSLLDRLTPLLRPGRFKRLFG